VDADDLMDEVMEEARANSLDRDTTSGLSEQEKEAIVRKIGLAALKFFLIKVHPQKRMIFDPKESVDLHGQTGPYIQNAYVRVQSVLRKQQVFPEGALAAYSTLFPEEKELLVQLFQFPDIIQESAEGYDPSAVANFCFQLAKSYHRFYHERSILKAESPAAGAFRLQLSMAVANVLRMGMDLLGIEMPEKM
jgi:arginyl-tRNA synthetase